MKIVYSLPHPADRLASQQAGHVVRARALLKSLETLGHQIVYVEAAAEQNTQVAVGIYRSIVKKLLPRSIAMRMRDTGRISHGKRYAIRLIESIKRESPDVILETHIAFSLAGKLASIETGVPLVIDDVAPAWEEQQQYGVGRSQAALDIHREVTQTAQLLVAVSPAIRRELLSQGLPESKVVTIPNGIDASLLQASISGDEIRKKYNLSPEMIVIGFIGSFQPYHRVELLVEAFAQLIQTQSAQVRLLLVGHGSSMAQCQLRAAELGIEGNIIFAGVIDYSLVPSYTTALDIAVIPGNNDFGNSMKVYDYAVMGRAIVAPAQQAMMDQVTHGQTAYLFTPDDQNAFVAALKTLIDNPEMRRSIGEQARLMAVECTWEKRAAALSEAIQQIISK